MIRLPEQLHLVLQHMKVERAYWLLQNMLGMVCMHADPGPLES